MWLVVGLGNPGPDYAAHRHNVGQMALDVLAERIGASFRLHKARAAVAEGRVAPGAALKQGLMANVPCVVADYQVDLGERT